MCYNSISIKYFFKFIINIPLGIFNINTILQHKNIKYFTIKSNI